MSEKQQSLETTGLKTAICDMTKMYKNLKPWVCIGEGPSQLCNTFSVPSEDTVFYVLQCENLSSNKVAHIVEELQKKPNKFTLTESNTCDHTV